MKIVCVGGGPAGLMFAMLARLWLPEAEVDVVERNARGVTYGWGVVFPETLLREIGRQCRETAAEIAGGALRWDDQHVRVQDARTVHLGRSGYSVGRAQLLHTIALRAERLGVSIRYEEAAVDSESFAGADLVVAADGANSRMRASRSEHFGTQIEWSQNRYIWLGTSCEFPSFTFGFESTPAGWIWFHGYRYAPGASTFIAECSPETWHGLGFDRMDATAGTQRLEEIFGGYLGPHRLKDQMGVLGRVGWQRFGTVTNRTWIDGKVVLLGDAAHTAHYSIGSGTFLAIGDALALVDALRTGAPLDQALANYEARRRPAVEQFQTVARNSATWFEHIPQLIAQSQVNFGYALLRRRDGLHAPPDPARRWHYPMYRAMQVGIVPELRRRIAATARNLRGPRLG